MTAATRNRVETLAGAIHRKCHCIRCRAHAAEFRRNIHAKKADGTWHPFVDAAPVLAHIVALHAEGMTYTLIARLARVDYDAIRRMRGKYRGEPASRQVRPDTAARILALKPQFTRQTPHARIPNRSALRRVQALRAIGWPVYALMHHSGLGVSTFTTMHRNAWVEMTTQRAIEALYELLHDQDPTQCGISPAMVRRGKRNAAKHNWAVPAAWTDIDTDEQPDRSVRAARYTKPEPGHRSRIVIDDTAELAAQGRSRAEIAERIGITWNAIEQAHIRASTELPVQLRKEHASEAAAPERTGDP